MAEKMNWSYGGDNGPENWHQIYSAACGNRQSPINITSDTLEVAYSYQKKRLRYVTFPNELNDLVNTGYTWIVYGTEKNQSYITGGPLMADYTLVEVHAHWNDSDIDGSEHSFNGKYQAAELHKVYQNKIYPTKEEAVTHPEGLCITATMLKLGMPHPEIQKVVDKLPYIMHKGDRATLDGYLNTKLFVPSNRGYWAYMGSMTYPPCTECVVWVVYDDPIEVSKEQLHAFRALRCHAKDQKEYSDCLTLFCEDRMVKNCRPGFKIGDRIILRCPGRHTQHNLQKKSTSTVLV